MSLKILLITQARVTSTRLPKKVFLPLAGTSVLDLHLKRLKKISNITGFMVATTHESGADGIIEIAKRNSFYYYQGSTSDVLDRFYQASLQFSNSTGIMPDAVIRVTSDCPLIDPKIVEDLISFFIAAKVDYASNCLELTFPDGMDAEIFTFSSLKRAWTESKLKSEREHVTPYIWKNSDISGGKIFTAAVLKSVENLSQFRLTIDQQEDYELLKKLVELKGIDASMQEYVHLFKLHPELSSINSHITANEGYSKSIKEDSK